MPCWLISWAFFGLFVGAIARFFWPGPRPVGLFNTMLLGIAGSIIGGWLTYLLMGGPDGYYAPAGWIMSIIGAIVLLWVARAVARVAANLGTPRADLTMRRSSRASVGRPQIIFRGARFDRAILGDVRFGQLKDRGANRANLGVDGCQAAGTDSRRGRH